MQGDVLQITDSVLLNGTTGYSLTDAPDCGPSMPRTSPCHLIPGPTREQLVIPPSSSGAYRAVPRDNQTGTGRM